MSNPKEERRLDHLAQIEALKKQIEGCDIPQGTCLVEVGELRPIITVPDMNLSLRMGFHYLNAYAGKREITFNAYYENTKKLVSYCMNYTREMSLVA